MEFFIIAVLILANGVLAMSEIALVSLRKSSLSAEAKNGDRRAREALALAGNPDRFFSTVQIGITLIGILTGIYSGDALAGKFADWLAGFGLPERAAILCSQAAIVAVATYLTLIFGELVPKRLGYAAPERVAKIVAPSMTLLSRAAAPFVFILEKSTGAVLRFLKIGPSESRVTEREIKSMIAEGEASGEIQKIERDIVERVFSLGDRCVGAIMTPRNEIVKIRPDMSADEVAETVKNFPHANYPVAGDSLDELEGIVALKDLCAKIADDNFSVSSALQPVHYFKDGTKIYHALEQMRRARVKSAVVCNEFGVTLGMVTLNDVIDAVLGDMPESGEDSDIIERKDGSWLVDGQCPFHDFLIFFGIDDVSENCNTVGGIILERLQRIPHAGEFVDWNGLRLEVVDMDGARIDKILITRISESGG